MAEPRPIDISQDARELQRGVLITYAGYAFKVALPVLLAFATRAYGAEAWGRFLAAQALVLIAARVCLFGLDKALLWAIAGRDTRDALWGVRPALLRVAVHTAAFSIAVQLALLLLSASVAAEYRALRVVSLGLVPFALSELLLHATMGLRRMELHVAVRETLTPLLQIACSLVLFELGLARNGLAWSFVLSQLVGLLVAWWGFRRLFRESSLAADSWKLPRALVSYAWPAWLAEIASSLLLRLDTVVLTALTDATTVGVWGVVAQFGNALRQMRRAYDPVVTALAARIAVQHDARRLADTFSYAAQMVSLTQLPVFAALVCFGDLVLPLYGPAFAQGGRAMSLLSALLLLSGGAGLAGLVLNGYGRSGLTLVNALLSVAIQLVLLLVLVPRFGLEGAASAVGGALLLVNLVQLLEMKLVTGSFNFTRRSSFSLGVLLSAGLCAGSALLLARALSLDLTLTRVSAMLGFALGYAAPCLHGLRNGVLRAPRDYNPASCTGVGP